VGLTDPSGDNVYAMDRVGQGMRARGLTAYPSRLRDTRGAIWDRPYGRSVNYYLRRPRTGTMHRQHNVYRHLCPALVYNRLLVFGSVRLTDPRPKGDFL